MAVVWPSKNNFANGDVLTATNMNNIADTLNVFNPTSATNGQIWTANGSGSGSYQTLSVNSITQLTTGTLSGASVTTATLSTAYKNLMVICRDVEAAGASTWRLQFNGDTTAKYNTIVNYEDSGTVNSFAQRDSSWFSLTPNGPVATNTNGSWYLMIPDYSSGSFHKVIQAVIGWQVSAASYNVANIAGYYEEPTAITSLTFLSGTNNFSSGTYFVYGIN